MNNKVKSESNFKKAVNELLGNPSNEEFEPELDLPEESESESAPQDYETSNDRIDNGIGGNKYMSSAKEKDTVSQSQPVRMENRGMVSVQNSVDSIIGADMEINGNVNSNSGIEIVGRVVGNVVCGGSIILRGNITGDVTASDIDIRGSISGNIAVGGRITINTGAWVKGDMTAHDIITDGNSEGDVKVEDVVAFKSAATVTGNVYARVFEMSAGAKVKGMLKTYD